MKTWFKAKQYGYGWYPATWQAWTILVVWLALVALMSLNIQNFQSPRDVILQFSLPLILSIILIIFIAYGTGEPPGWRWHGKLIRKS